MGARCAPYGLLRAASVQSLFGNNQSRRWNDDVLPAACVGLLENVWKAVRGFLVLYRHRIGRIRKAHRHNLLLRRRWALRESVHYFTTRVAGKRREHSPGDEVPR